MVCHDLPFPAPRRPARTDPPHPPRHDPCSVHHGAASRIPVIPRRGILKAGVAGLMLAGLPAPAEARTPQPAGPATRVALMSCIHQARPAPALDLVVGYDPDIAIFAGDNVYGDVSGPEMTELAAAYALAATRPAFTTLRRDRLVMPIWDDHDRGIDDGGGDFPHSTAAKALFQAFWALPADDPRRGRAGLYHAVITGPVGRRVQVILLDCRSFRSPLALAAGGWRPVAAAMCHRGRNRRCWAPTNGRGWPISFASPPSCGWWSVPFR
ncbi:hypothetical protein ACFQ4K_11915 [Tistrella bauzanensis]